VPQLVMMIAAAQRKAFRPMKFLAVFNFIKQGRWVIDLAPDRFRVSRH
jgi:hypothetical protein